MVNRRYQRIVGTVLTAVSAVMAPPAVYGMQDVGRQLGLRWRISPRAS